MIKHEFEISNVFNEHYINIVEKSSGYKPVNIESLFDLGSLKDEKPVVEKIIESYRNHPSIIRKTFSSDLKIFNFQKENFRCQKLLETY